MIIRVVNARWQHNGRSRHILIRDLAQEVMNAVEPGALLVVGVHDPPGRFGNVRASSIASLAFV